jgi:hypothetical protein
MIQNRDSDGGGLLTNPSMLAVQTWSLPYVPSFGSISHREARSVLKIDQRLIVQATSARTAA